MNFEYNDDTLTITVDADEQAELRQNRQDDPDLFASDRALHDHFEDLVCNSELQWVDPADTGDLTDAPMLGILGEAEPGGNGEYGKVLAGSWEDSAGVMQTWFHPIEKRWAFMSYQVRSALDDLADEGKVVFVSHQ
jgi:hypothetical protein